ncbi:MAG: hypothetical protein J6C23_02685 [Clostridia bacterium]|nr:hypothetical protein [Clostridia bacterium]MBO5223401.1 hypothetical protein [Clostridia bacterium]
MKVLSVNGQEFVINVDEISYFGLVRRRRFLFWRVWRLQIVLKNGKALYVQNSYEDLIFRYERSVAYGIERAAYIVKAGGV